MPTASVSCCLAIGTPTARPPGPAAARRAQLEPRRSSLGRRFDTHVFARPSVQHVPRVNYLVSLLFFFFTDSAWCSTDLDMGYSQFFFKCLFVSTCSCAPRVFRRASQGPQGRVVPFRGARQGPDTIVGYVLQSAAPTGPCP